MIESNSNFTNDNLVNRSDKFKEIKKAKIDRLEIDISKELDDENLNIIHSNLKDESQDNYKFKANNKPQNTQNSKMSNITNLDSKSNNSTYNKNDNDNQSLNENPSKDTLYLNQLRNQIIQDNKNHSIPNTNQSK